MYRDLGTVINKTARKKKCSVVSSYCGHGCHELFHTAPNVPHYARNKAVGVMKPGHCFTIEPMINRGTRPTQPAVLLRLFATQDPYVIGVCVRVRCPARHHVA